MVEFFVTDSVETLAVDPAGLDEDSLDRVKLPPLQIALA